MLIIFLFNFSGIFLILFSSRNRAKRRQRRPSRKVASLWTVCERVIEVKKEHPSIHLIHPLREPATAAKGSVGAVGGSRTRNFSHLCNARRKGEMEKINKICRMNNEKGTRNAKRAIHYRVTCLEEISFCFLYGSSCCERKTYFVRARCAFHNKEIVVTLWHGSD